MSRYKNPTLGKLSTLHFTFIIVSISALTRFWKLSELFHWTLDEEFWAYVPHNIATLKHIPLIGGHISGTGLYSGPLFVWSTAPFFALIKSHPLGIAFLVSTLGIATTILIYKLFSSLDRPRVSTIWSPPFLAALFYATSTLAVIYDRKYWNATPIPFLSLITLYLIHRLIKTTSDPNYSNLSRREHVSDHSAGKGPREWTPTLREPVADNRPMLLKTPGIIRPITKLTLALSLALSLAFHAHMTGAVLIAFTLIAWFIYKLPRKIFINLVVSFLILQAPLYLFELRHNFTNTNALMNLLSSQSSQSTSLSPALSQTSNLILTTFSRLIYTPATDISSELTLCTDYAHTRSTPATAVFVLAAIILIYSLKLLIRQKDLFSILLWTNIALLITYRLIAPPDSWYPGQLSEYFLLPSFISFFFIAATLTAKSLKHWPTLITTLIFFLIVINLHTTLNLTHSQGFARKDRLVKLALSQINDQPFTLNVSGPACQVYGYRYLFSIYNREPTSSYLDPTFLWLYQDSLDTRPATLNLTLYPETDRIQLEKL